MDSSCLAKTMITYLYMSWRGAPPIEAHVRTTMAAPDVVAPEPSAHLIMIQCERLACTPDSPSYGHSRLEQSSLWIQVCPQITVSACIRRSRLAVVTSAKTQGHLCRC